MKVGSHSNNCNAMEKINHSTAIKPNWITIKAWIVLVYCPIDSWAYKIKGSLTWSQPYVAGSNHFCPELSHS
jgi:hypothetical protein